jgi:arylsulfatase A-like enzyme
LGEYFQEVHYDPEIQVVMEGDETPWSPEPCLRLLADWLSRQSGKRFFAYIHLMPPHKPYTQPAEMTALFRDQTPPGFDPDRYHPEEYDFPIDIEPHADVFPLPEWINLYDANYRYGDWGVGETERLLKEAGVFEQTLFIVTSDHGEAFGEHGFVWHGEPIHDEVSHVPLLIRFPAGARAGTISALTESIDILPTVFDLFGLPFPEDQVQGRSLAGAIAGVSDRVHDYAFTRAPRHGHKYMVRGRDHALLLWGTGKWRTLYDLRADPAQTENVIKSHPEVARAMVAAFEEFASRQRVPPLNFLDPNVPPPELPAAEKTRLAPDVKKALQTLGYLE